MTKFDEITKPNSCLQKSSANEMLFVLRAHDIAAPTIVRAWVKQRIHIGKNVASDSEIQEALACAEEMERQQQAGA